MEADLWSSIVLYAVLLFLSGFFSGSESAYFSLSPADIRQFREQKKKSKSAARIVRLLDNSRRLLSAILIGNTIVNVAAATVAALLTSRLLPEESMSAWGVFVVIGVVTLSILLFSEITPKIFAIQASQKFARLASVPLQAVVVILTPVTSIYEMITNMIKRMIGYEKEVPFVNEEELKTLIEVGEQKGTLDQAEREMIHSIFEFRETFAKEIMVPRMDMVCIDQETTVEDVLTLVKTKGHSRIPVYNDNVDNVIGILYVKDLLPYMQKGKSLPKLTEMVRKPYFVPEIKMIDELLREFQKERIHMAVVVDEYGGTAGLITLEDVIEEIVGDIRDEYDRDVSLIRKIDSKTWTADGKVDIEDLNEKLSLDLPTEEDFESLGGFIFSQLGKIPQEKDSIQYKQHTFIVEKVQRQRIKKVTIVFDPKAEQSKNE